MDPSHNLMPLSLVVFGVKIEGDLMPGALNQLVGSRQWILVTGTLI